MTPNPIYAQPVDGERVLVCAHVDHYPAHLLHWLMIDPPQKVLLDEEPFEARHIAFCKHCTKIYHRDYYAGVTGSRVWQDGEDPTPPAHATPPAA